MKVQKLLPLLGWLLLILLACHQEHSIVGQSQLQTDTLPSNYPFATGYCKDGGTSLGIFIEDTNNYAPSNTSPLPTSLLLDMPTPGDQGNQGSCTAWATVYGVGSYYARLTAGKVYSDTDNLSPKFTYNQIAKGHCTCTSFLDNLYLLKTQGACPLTAMPYDPEECLNQPDSLQKSIAGNYKIKGWQKVDLHDLTLIKRAIVEKKPLLFAIRVDDGFLSLTVPYIWKTRVGAMGEGHAMVITGFDDGKNAFRIMNSWSTAWGDKGFAWIDYTFFLQNVIEGGYIVF
jgi:hypothetical protein